jgi:multimeric flavodoxin WrbA
VSNSESLAEVVLGALREEGVETDVIRLADHQIDPGAHHCIFGRACAENLLRVARALS